MPEPLELTFGPFAGGLVNEREAHLLRPDEAQVADRVDVTSGAITGTRGHKLISTNVVHLTWVGSLSGSVKVFSGTRSAPVYDADRLYTTLSYPGLVHKYVNGNWTTRYLGVGAAGAMGYTQGYALHGIPAGVVGYMGWAVTYVTSDGLESNPNFLYTPNGGLFDFNSSAYKFTIPVEANPSFNVVSRNIYFTGVGGSEPPSTHYFAFNVPNNTTTDIYVGSVNNSGGRWDLIAPNGPNWGATFTKGASFLYWKDGGYPELAGDTGRSIATLYIEDHGIAPGMDLFANALHAKIRSGKPRGGILFGVESGTGGKRIRWSLAGNPEYFPSRYYADMADAVEAIITNAGFTVIFTPTGSYQVSGDDEADFDFSQLAIGHHIRSGAGKSAAWTPFGIIYLSQSGLTVTDGHRSDVLSGKLSREYWDGLTVKAATFFRDFYYLFCSTKTVCVDLREGIGNARFFEDPLVVEAIFNTGTRLYVCSGTSVYEWGNKAATPSDDGYQHWIWKTGRLSDGERVTFERARISYEGDLWFYFVDDAGADQLQKSLSSATKTEELIWLPVTAPLKATGTRPALKFLSGRNAVTGKVAKLYGLKLFGERHG